MSAHTCGEAISLPTAVRLRLSFPDRLLTALRWTLGLAGTVVVMWLGSVFLAAAPAAAATAVVVSPGMVKTAANPARSTEDGGNGGDSDPEGEGETSGSESESDGDEGSEQSDGDDEQSGGDEDEQTETPKPKAEQPKTDKGKKADEDKPKADKPKVDKGKADKGKADKGKADKPKDDEGKKAGKDEAKAKDTPKAPKAPKAPKNKPKAEKASDEDTDTEAEDEQAEEANDRSTVAGDTTKDKPEAAQDQDADSAQVSTLSARGPPSEKKDSAKSKKTGTSKTAATEKDAAKENLTKQVSADLGELDDEDTELVDDVVDGHRDLAKREKQLAADKQRVAAGTLTDGKYEDKLEDFEDRRDDVYDDTEDLMEATGREIDTVDEDDLGDEGAAAGCGRSGAFTACGAVSKSADGEKSYDRCLGLSGVSGCGVSVGKGAVKASAKCDDSGCDSKATSGTSNAFAKCTGDDCDVRSSADRDGSDGKCGTKGGTCASHSDGTRTEKKAKLTASSDSRCTGDCETSTETKHEEKAVVATSNVECRSADCRGDAKSTTGGDAPAQKKSSTATGSCNAHGAGGRCENDSRSEIDERTDETTRAITVVTVSTANAKVECDGTTCGGSATSSSSARDLMVSPDARGSNATADCVVTGGGCTGDTSSAASSAPDYMVIDPATGLPVTMAAGPSSTATATASLWCAEGVACTGTVNTFTSSFDGKVTRTSKGTAACTSTTDGCQAQSVSTASSGPGATVALSGGPVNLARLPAGPSAASASGALLFCGGEVACTGKVTSAATGTDPTVSAKPRGSHGEGTCAGVLGGVCQAVTNSGASSGPDANAIAPLMQARSTENATVASETTGEPVPQEQQQPGPSGQQAVLPGPVAPGSAANAGGPTVPGASSWSMADATLDCAGSTPCQGTAQSFAAGSEGPNAVNGANGARGPPAGSRTSGSCSTTASGCQVQTTASAGTGQVVADVVAEQNYDAAAQALQDATAAEQLAAEAAEKAAAPGATARDRTLATQAAAQAKQARQAATAAVDLAAKPVTDAPAAFATSNATAQCAGPGCTATTTGANPGLGETTTATCRAAQGGCVVASDTTITMRTVAEGSTVDGETGSTLLCPDAGCVGRVTGAAKVTLGRDGLRTTSTATGNTACTGTGPCQAGVRISANTTISGTGTGRSESTTATVAVTCDDGTAAGCAIHAVSATDVTAAAGVHARATATCTGMAACTAATSGTVQPDLAQVAYQCAAVGNCVGHSDGAAGAGTASGHGVSDCRSGANGDCAGSTLVGAGQDGTVMAGASCQGSAGAACRYHFEATASQSAASGASWANAYAHGSETGTVGGGTVQVMAMAAAGGTAANAQAFCVGAANCVSTYAAHAEAHDRLDQYANPDQPDMAEGYWSADGSGTCRGSGNGGCGVQAWANAGPGGSGGAICTGDCSGFVQEQGGPSTFTKTGPSWNEMMATAHTVEDIEELVDSLKPEDEFVGYTVDENGYTIYIKEKGQKEATEQKCTFADCGSGKVINGGGGQITFSGEEKNPQTTQHSDAEHDDHRCTANVGCALTNHGNGDSDYWVKGEGDVTDGVSGTTMHFKNNQPVGGGPANLNEGSFASRKGRPFSFTCNGGCKGAVSHVDLGLGKPKMTDQIDLAGTPNLLSGRDGLGNLTDYSHSGSGTITLMNRDGSMMEPIISGNDLTPQRQETSGLTPSEWADIAGHYGYTPWDKKALEQVLEPGDSLIGYQADGKNYTVYVKEADGEITERTCPIGECGPVEGGRGAIDFSGAAPVASQQSKPGHDDNTCTSATGCGLATDGKGNSMWWLVGNGTVHDGISGSTITYGNSTATTNQGGNFANTEDTPFTANCPRGCHGEIGFGDKIDHISLGDATNVLLSSRTAAGGPGRITWSGKGYFRSAEGDEVWADLVRPAYDINNENPQSNGSDRADDTTLIITRGKDGGPGYYALPTGQIGRIQTVEGYVVDNRVGADPADEFFNDEHAGDTLRVTTPGKDGKGGILHCSGRCEVSGPGLPELNTPCDSCTWTEYLATGTGRHPGGYRAVWNSSATKTWYTPTGDELTCDGCQFVQYNRDAQGNGGGAVCRSEGEGSCSGKSREGLVVSDEVGLRMLYANADGTHQGYSCESNKKSCGNRPDLWFDWKGTPDETWALIMDPTYQRSSTGSQMDKDLAKALGLEPDDPLPPLTADAEKRLKSLEEQDWTDGHMTAWEKYQLALPEMSDEEQAELGFTYLEQQSTDRTLREKYGPVYDEKIKPLVEAYQSANADFDLSAAERTALEEKFKGLEGIDPGLVYEWSAARGVLDGVDDATWILPDFKEIEAQLGADPEMVKEIAGPKPTHPQDMQYGMTDQERAVDNIRKQFGLDAKGNPNAPYNVAQNALLAFRPRQTALDLDTASHLRALVDHNAKVEAFNANPGSMAEYQQLALQGARLDANWAAITGERETITAGTKGLTGKADPFQQQQRREMDVAIGAATDDRIWSDRLAAASQQLSAINAMRDSLDRSDPQQKKWAESLDALSSLASLNYGGIARNLDERADDNPLGRLALPSSGHPDFAYAMTAGKNLPEYDHFEGALKEYFKDLTRDELANMAAHQSADAFEGDILDRKLQLGEGPEGDVLKAIKELGGKGYTIDAERMMHRKGGTDEWTPMLVYRVLDSNGTVVGFVDGTGAHFDSLQDYRDSNYLADDSDLITRADWNDPHSELTITSAHNTTAFEWGMDYVVAPAFIVGGIVTSVFATPMAGAVVASPGVAWYVGKAGYNIYDRAQHGQSNSWDNPAAVMDYLTIGTAFVGGAGGLVRPIARTAMGAALRGAAVTGGAGMMAYGVADTAVNWGTMTPGQRRNAIIGLSEGAVMMGLSPLAARAAGNRGAVPGATRGGAVPGRRGTPQTITTTNLGARIRAVMDDLGTPNSLGGKKMTSPELAAELRKRGVNVPDEAALRAMIDETDGVTYTGDPALGFGLVRTGVGDFAGAQMKLGDNSLPQGKGAGANSAKDITNFFENEQLRDYQVNGARPGERGTSASAGRNLVDNLLDRAGWPEAARNGALPENRLQQLADPDIYRAIEAAMGDGRIVGVKNWLQFNATKDRAQLVDVVNELEIARGIADRNPGVQVEVGLEKTAPRKADGGAMTEFDFKILRDGREVSRIELMSIKKATTAVGKISEGLEHAIEKVKGRQGSRYAVGGAEAFVRARIPKETKAGSRKITVADDGTLLKVRRDNGAEIERSNLYDDIATNLAKKQDHTLADRLTLQDLESGNWIVFDRHGTTWTWTIR